MYLSWQWEDNISTPRNTHTHEASNNHTYNNLVWFFFCYTSENFHHFSLFLMAFRNWYSGSNRTLEECRFKLGASFWFYRNKRRGCRCPWLMPLDTNLSYPSWCCKTDRKNNQYFTIIFRRDCASVDLLHCHLL